MDQEGDIWEMISRPVITQLSVQFDIERETYLEDKWLSNFKKAQGEPDRILLDKIRKKRLLLKYKYISRTKTGYDILKECRENEDIFIYWDLVPEPGKQSEDEKFQIQYMNTHQNRTRFRKPEKSLAFVGNTTISISSENIHKRTKTFDAVNDKDNIFLYMKYTKTTGGAQDNQCDDVKNFVKTCDRYLFDNINTHIRYFICVLDGKYYTPEKKHSIRMLISEPHRKIIKVMSSAEMVYRLNI